MKKATILITTAVTATRALALSACGGQAGGATSATAVDFPQAGTTIERIVPFAAGAVKDILARIVAPAMQEDLGANIKVVNKEGGSQVVGLNYAAQAKPDGQTLVDTNIPSILGRYLDPSKKAAFDRSSFTPHRILRHQLRSDRRQRGQPVQVHQGTVQRRQSRIGKDHRRHALTRR